MPYIHTIGLENFRLFGDKTIFELAPITILTGTNSSGKSSLIKALQLFKSSIKETGSINKLNFTGGRHNLGWFGQTLNFESEKNDMVFTFDFPLNHLMEKTLIDLTYTSNSKQSLTGNLKGIKIYFNTGEIIFKVEEGDVIKVEKDPNKKDSIINRDYSYQSVIVNADIEFLIEKLRLTFDSFWVKNNLPIEKSEKRDQLSQEFVDFLNKNYEMYEFSQANIFKEFYFKFGDSRKNTEDDKKFLPPLFYDLSDNQKSELKEKLKILATVGIHSRWEKAPDVTFEDFLANGVYDIFDYLNLDDKISFTIGDEFTEEKKKLILSDFGKFVFEDFLEKEVGDILTRILKKPYFFESLSSFRANTERMYTSNTEIVEINKLLWDFSQSNEKNWKKIKEFFNISLKHFGIGDEIKINQYQGVITEILVIKEGREILLADLGYGYSQLIPIIMKVALIGINRSKEDFLRNRLSPTVFLLEEPESNLHPSLQSKLADFIILSANIFNIQFIIETHSEYLIRNFQYLTAKKELNPWDIKILYFHHPGSEDFKESPYRIIEIGEDGRLSNEFGEGFFDEIPRLLAFLYNSSSN